MANSDTQTQFLFVSGAGDEAQAKNLQGATTKGFKVISMVYCAGGHVNNQQIVVLLQKN